MTLSNTRSSAPIVWDDFRRLLDGIEEYAIFVLDVEGRVASWNRGAELIHGYGAPEILGEHHSMFYTEEDIAAGKPAQQLETARTVGRAEDEGWRARKDRTRFWANVVITPLRDDTGTLCGYAKVTQDVTVRRRDEQRLREAEERFHQIIDAVTEYAIFMLDPRGYVVTWNPGAERTKLYRAEEIIGQHFSRFYTVEDRADGKPARMLEAAARHGRVEDESIRIRKDGSRFWANVVISALRDKHGQLVGFAKVTRDLTERRATEEKLRRSEERFRLLIEGISDYAIYMLDPQGCVSTWNIGAERMKGYSAAEILGCDFSRFFPLEDVHAGKPQRELEQARTHGRFEDEGFRIRKDGSRFWANVIITALHDAQGVLVGFAKITRVLTARREAEAAERRLLREQAAREAAQNLAAKSLETNRIKDEFLATVSHELRTPLNAIVGWTTLLRQSPLDPKVAKGMEVIDRNAQAQVKLVEDILDVSRIITGKLRIEPRPSELVAIANAAIDVVRPSANAKQISIELSHAEPEYPLTVDPERLQQVIWNLLSNAVKFTNPLGSIRVAIERGDMQVRVCVSDSGQGIDPDFLPHVFERFRQADSSTTRRVGGLGLGLALVRHIIELHGGTVTAESAGPGHGSTFSFELPLRTKIQASTDVPEAVAVNSSQPIPAVNLGGLRVLVVDDDPDARHLMDTLLRGVGATVETAGSVEEGLEALLRFRPEVLVSDIGMAGEDGYAFMRRVRALAAADGGRVPAIALTAYTRNEDRKNALAAGFDLHIGKPVNARELVTAVASLGAVTATRP
jgi:PAS domain S-box-containing protein